MENESNFSAPRRNRASRATRSDPTSKAFSSEASSSQVPDWRRTLRDLPASRTEAVRRARKLIADPGYPPPRTEKILARHLAVQLTDEDDPLPT